MEWKSAVASDETQAMNSNSTSAVLETREQQKLQPKINWTTLRVSGIHDVY